VERVPSGLEDSRDDSRDGCASPVLHRTDHLSARKDASSYVPSSRSSFILTHPCPEPTPPVSPAAPSTRTYLSLITRTISFPHASRITAWYLFASLISTFVFINLWTTRHESHEGNTLDLGFWKPTARHPWHLNERVLFLYLGNALFAVFIAHKGIFDGAWGKEQWPVDNVRLPSSTLFPLMNDTDSSCFKASLAQRLTARVKTTTLHQLPLYTLLFTALYTPFFWLLRRPIATLLIRHSFGFFRPFIAQIARNKSLVGWGLVGRLMALGYATGVLVRLPGIVFDISATQVGLRIAIRLGMRLMRMVAVGLFAVGKGTQGGFVYY
jgi:hypothetical protein